MNFLKFKFGKINLSLGVHFGYAKYKINKGMNNKGFEHTWSCFLKRSGTAQSGVPQRVLIKANRAINSRIHYGRTRLSALVLRISLRCV